VDTIIIDGEEVHIDKDSILNYEDMLLINGEPSSILNNKRAQNSNNPYTDIQEDTGEDNQYLTTGEFMVPAEDDSSLQVSPMTPY
jgi:hypothetical protein